MALIDIDETLLEDERFIRFVINLRSRINKKAKQAKEKPKDFFGKEAISRYCERYSVAYAGAKPVIRAMWARQLKDLIKDSSFDRVITLIDSYFIMPDPEAVRVSHDLGYFFRNLQVIARYADTGEFIPRGASIAVDKEMTERMRKLKESNDRVRALQGVFRPQLVSGGSDDAS